MAILCFPFIFFPYIKVVQTGTDLQPYALIACIVAFFALRIQRLPFPILILLLPIAGSIILGALDDFSMDSIRSIAGYASLFIISAATYNILLSDGRLKFLYIEMATYCWLLAGLLQVRGYGAIFASILPIQVRGVDQAGDTGRGVIGLAPEPTFYGVWCAAMMTLTYFYAHEHGWTTRRKAVMAILIYQLVFLSKSTAVIFAVFFFGAVSLAIIIFSLRLSLRTIVITGLLVAGAWWIGETVLSDSRIYATASIVVEDPFKILYMDESIHARVTHAIFAVKGFWDNRMAPHGYDRFWDYLDTMAVEYPEWFWRIPYANRIMSGYGMAFFELGALAFLIVFSVTFSLYRFFYADIRRFLLWAITINAMLFASVPIGYPLLAFLIGFLNYYAFRRSHVRVFRPVPVAQDIFAHQRA